MLELTVLPLPLFLMGAKQDKMSILSLALQVLFTKKFSSVVGAPFVEPEHVYAEHEGTDSPNISLVIGDIRELDNEKQVEYEPSECEGDAEEEVGAVGFEDSPEGEDEGGDLHHEADDQSAGNAFPEQTYHEEHVGEVVEYGGEGVEELGVEEGAENEVCEVTRHEKHHHTPR